MEKCRAQIRRKRSCGRRYDQIARINIGLQTIAMTIPDGFNVIFLPSRKTVPILEAIR
jgi:hypothetical protein